MANYALRPGWSRCISSTSPTRGGRRRERQDGASDTNGLLAFAIDPSRLLDRAWMLDEVAAMAGYITASPPGRSGEPVLIPGDPERANRTQRLKEGVPIDEETWREITLAARGLNVLIETPQTSA